MTPQTPDMQAVLERLEKLERQNRRLKRAGLAALIGIGALLLMGQAKPPLGFAPTGQTIEARKFVLKDENGATRAELSTFLDISSLSLHSADGQTILSLIVSDGGANVTVNDGQDWTKRETVSPKVWLGYGRGAATFLDLFPSQGNASIGINVSNDGPTVHLQDNSGFQSTLGVTSLERVQTGESTTTSAASLTLFGKDRKVIWRAP